MNILLSLILGGGKGTKISVVILVLLLTISTTLIVLKSSEINGLKSENSKLTIDNNTLVSNNKVLKDNQGALLATNKANAETVRKLDDERREAKAAIAALAMANKRDRMALDSIGNKIDNMIKNPANDGEVAPVLREVVRDIQNQRDTK